MNGTNNISDYKNLISNLEDQELEAAATGPTSPQIYGQLLAIYLLTNDLFVKIFFQINIKSII